MAVRIVHKINSKIDGLKKGNIYLSEELRKAGQKIGLHLQGKVRDKQRIDTGQERRRTLFRVRQTRAALLQVSVYNTVVQALVDETGAVWSGTQPPSHAGSKLYRWVQRKGIATRASGSERRAAANTVRRTARAEGASKAEALAFGRSAAKAVSDRADKQILRTTFLIARAIGRRGLPRPGDPLRKPFEVTRKEERPRVLAMVNNAIFQSVKRMNTK